MGKVPQSAAGDRFGDLISAQETSQSRDYFDV